MNNEALINEVLQLKTLASQMLQHATGLERKLAGDSSPAARKGKALTAEQKQQLINRRYRVVSRSKQ